MDFAFWWYHLCNFLDKKFKIIEIAPSTIPKGLKISERESETVKRAIYHKRGVQLDKLFELIVPNTLNFRQFQTLPLNSTRGTGLQFYIR